MTKLCVGDVSADGALVRELMAPGETASFRFWDKLNDRALLARAGVASAAGRTVKAFGAHQGQAAVLVAEYLCIEGEPVRSVPCVPPPLGQPDQPTPNAYALPDGRLLPMPASVTAKLVPFDIGGGRVVQAVRIDPTAPARPPCQPRPGVVAARALLAGDVDLARRHASRMRPTTWTVAELRALAGACEVVSMRGGWRAPVTPRDIMPGRLDDAAGWEIARGRAGAMRGECARVLRRLAVEGPSLGVVTAAEGLGAILGTHLTPLDGNVEHLVVAARARARHLGLALCADVAADVERFDAPEHPGLQGVLEIYRRIVEAAAVAARPPAAGLEECSPV